MPAEKPPTYLFVPTIRIVRPDGPHSVKRVVVLVSNDNQPGEASSQPPPMPRY